MTASAVQHACGGWRGVPRYAPRGNVMIFGTEIHGERPKSRASISM